MNKYKISVPFHAHSDSSLDGAATVSQIVKRYKELGSPYATLTEHGNLNSAMDLYTTAKKEGMKPILGMEAYLVNPFHNEYVEIYRRAANSGLLKLKAKNPEAIEREIEAKAMNHYLHVTVHFKDKWAYQYFCGLSHAMWNRSVKKYGEEKPMITMEELEGAAGHITIGSSCMRGPVQYFLLPSRDGLFQPSPEKSKYMYDWLKRISGKDGFFVEVFPHEITHSWVKPETDYSGNIIKQGSFAAHECTCHAPTGDLQLPLNQWVVEHAEKNNDKVIISLDSHFATQDQKVIQDARLGNGDEQWRFFNSYHIMTTDEAAQVLQKTLKVSDKKIEEWVDNSYQWASNFDSFKLETSKERWILVGDPDGFMQRLKPTIDKWGRMDWKDPAMLSRLKTEIDTLAHNDKLNLLGYIDTVEDLADYCRKNDILMNVRGSAGGSLLLYLIGVSAVNPLLHDLSFGRFLTEGRILANNLPDADIDLSDQEGAMNYWREKYGNRFARLSTDLLLRLKSSIKDAERSILGKVRKETEDLCKALPATPQGTEDSVFVFGEEKDGVHIAGVFDTNEKLRQYAADNPVIWNSVSEMLGIQRSKSQHACIDGTMLVDTGNGISMLKDAKTIDKKPVTVWSSGIKPTVRVLLNNGVSIKCTPDHKFVMNDGKEVEAKDLTGMIANFSPPSTVFKNIAKDKEECFTLGWLLRDGHVMKHGISTFYFTGIKDNEPREKIEHFLKSKTTIWLDKTRKDKTYCGNFTDLNEWGWTKNRLPKLFWELDFKSQCSFMKGVFSSNGYILTTRSVLGIKLAYPDLISDIALWFSYFNVKTSAGFSDGRKTSWNNGVYKSKNSYSLILSDLDSLQWFLTHIGFEQSYKSNVLKSKNLSRDRAFIKKTSIAKEIKYLKVIKEDVCEVFDFNEPTESVGRINGTLVHNCGVVIMDKPVTHYMPMIKVGSDWVTGYSPKSVELVGGVKYDLLGLNTLRDMQLCLRSIKDRLGIVIDPFKLPYDKEVWENFQNGDTAGVFQFDTPTIKPFVISTKPNSIDDLAALTALGRPGTLDAIDPHTSKTLADLYVARKKGEEEIRYIHPDLEPIFKETQGIALFQEQTIKIFTTIGEMTDAEADEVRRGIGKKIKKVLDEASGKLKEKCLSKGWSEMQVNDMVDQIMASANYSFNKSHSVSYSYVAYACMYLKYKYKLDWWKAVLINSSKEEMASKFWKHVQDFTVLPDINISTDTYEIVGDKIVTPFSILTGVGEKAYENLIQHKPYKNLEHFVRCHFPTKEEEDQKKLNKKAGVAVTGGKKSAVNVGIARKLISAGVLDSLFPEGSIIEEKLRDFETVKAAVKGKKPEAVPEEYIGVSSLGKYLLRKQLIQIHSEDLRPILLLNRGGKERNIKAADRKGWFTQDHYPVLDGNQIEWIKNSVANGADSYVLAQRLDYLLPEDTMLPKPSIIGESSRIFCGIAYVISEKALAYKQKTRQATKLVLDINGFFTEEVLWPSYQMQKVEEKNALTGEIEMVEKNVQQTIAPMGFKGLPVIVKFKLSGRGVSIESVQRMLEEPDMEKYNMT